MKSVIKNAAFAVGICFLGMAGAQAGPQGEPQLVVGYSDLDLSSQAGARVLIGRIGMAASQVCGGVPDIRDLGRLALYRSCRQKAMADAVARVGSPAVNAAYGISYSQMASRQ